MENKLNKIAIAYCRVSTEEQAREGLSVESQEISCLKKISEDGCTLLKVIKDEGVSAGSLKRPGMQELIQLVLGKKIDFVYTVHSDRIARDTLDYLNLMKIMEEKGVQLKFINQSNFEKNDSSSKFVSTIMAGVNQFQRDITGEKVLATMRNKARAGYFPNKAPVGYKNVSHPEAADRFARKVVEVDEVNAPFIKEAFKLYDTGNYSVFDIVDILHEKGFRTRIGTKVAHSQWFEILKNPFYVGELHWGGVDLIEGKHPPLIDRDMFERVQKILDGHNHHACRKRKFEWLLNGFLVCYKHTCRYTAEWHLKKRIAYYHCTKSGCPRYVEISKLEDMVADKFKALEFSRDFIELILEKVKGIFYDRRQSYENKRQGLVNQKNAFEAKMRVAEDKLLSKTISDDDFTRMRREIQIVLNDIDSKTITLQREKDIDVDMAREVISLTNNIYETYKKSTSQLKRLLLGFFWEKFEVHDGIIIKSISSTLFEELIKAEKAFIKNQNTNIPSVTNKFINSTKWCPEPEIIITILSDKKYMEGMYSKLLYIKEMSAI